MCRTNIDLLHQAILDHEKTWLSLASGKTTILLHALAAQIQLYPSKNIFVYLENLRNWRFFEPRIEKIFDEQGIIVLTKKNRFEWLVRFENVYKNVIFFNSSQSLSGHKDFSEVDLRDF